MKNPIRNGIIALIASSLVFAADPAEGRQQPGDKPPPAYLQDSPGPKLSVNFRGGPLQDYIVALQQAAGDTPVNVVVPAEAKKVVLPPIQLREVTIGTALSAIRAAFEANSEHKFHVDRIGGPLDQTFAVVYLREGPAPTYVPGAVPGQMVATARRLEVYSIRDLIEPAAVVSRTRVAYEDILAAVDVAMELLGAPEAPQIKFHKETGLLLVAGTPNQTEAVGALIERVRSDLQRRWSEERQGAKAAAERERRLTIARNDARIAELELIQAEEQLKRLEQLVSQGVASSDELGQARIEREKAKANLERRMLEMRAAEQEMSEAKEGPSVVVVYDVADLVASNPEILTLVESTKEKLGGEVTVQGIDGRATKIVVRGSEPLQESVRSLLENYRARVAPTGKPAGR